MSRPAGSKNKVYTDKPDTLSVSMPVNPVIIQDDGKIKDLESRIHEIECFRNPSSIEGKIRDLATQIEDIKVQIDKINGVLNKAFAIEPQKVSENVLKHSQKMG